MKIRQTRLLARVALGGLALWGWLAIAPLGPLASIQAQLQPNCKNPQTQLDLNLCAGQRAQTADRQLNQVYQKVRAKYKGRPSENQLVDAQLAWIDFRDKECALFADRAKGGSIAPMLKANCLERLTIARTQDLQNYLKEGF